MNKKWFAAFVVLCACISLFAMFMVGKSYEHQTTTMQIEYQLTLSRNETAHWSEAWDGLYLEYQNAKDVADFWANAYHDAEARYSDLLWHPLIQEREVIKEVVKYQQLTDFVSLEELKAFMAQDDTDQRIILTADSSGKITFDGICEDYAFQLEDRAAQIGKKLETEVLTRSEYIKHYGNDGGLKVGDGHMINKAIIGNKIYFIEPQTDEIWTNWELD